MAKGRRCDLGCESWPDEPIYSTCPACGEATKQYTNLTPLDPEDAQRFLLLAQFEEFYARRCALRGISVDGPIPEEALPA